MNCNELQSASKASCYLIKRPKALQWFHDGQLYKASDEERQAGRFELFLDLLYVAIVANFSDNLSEHPDVAHLVKYILIFALAFHIWSDLRELMNSYYTDDIVQRLIILWVMALLILYGNNAPRINEGDGGLSALRTSAGAYMCARFTTACAFLISSFASHYHRAQARFACGFMMGSALLCIPLFFESVPQKTKVILVVILVVYQEGSSALTLSPWLKKKLDLTFSTAMDIAHEIDRMAAFFIIVSSLAYLPSTLS
jgi:low temperature requirement protein LtrA